MAKDPRNVVERFYLHGCVGTVSIKAEAIRSVRQRTFPTAVVVNTDAGDFVLDAGRDGGIYIKLLRIIANCVEYAAAADEVAAEAETRIA